MKYLIFLFLFLLPVNSIPQNGIYSQSYEIIKHQQKDYNLKIKMSKYQGTYNFTIKLNNNVITENFKSENIIGQSIDTNEGILIYNIRKIKFKTYDKIIILVELRSQEDETIFNVKNIIFKFRKVGDKY